MRTIHEYLMNIPEQLNFLLTNRIPRRLLTRCMGWYSRIENPWLTRCSIAVWRLFAPDLNLEEAESQPFRSVHDCFIRKLKPGLRPIDPRDDIVISPCDAMVGAFGPIDQETVFQAKGFPYQLSDLIPHPRLYEKYRNGIFVTLRLKSSMYHRFHAPLDCNLHEIHYISGDVWNVNPIALKRIEKLFCKNERALLDLETQKPERAIMLVPVAAVLVASMKFHCLNVPLNLQYRGANRLACDAHFQKGDEIGYFEHGSTIILFATSNYAIDPNIETGSRINMGQPLLVERTHLLPPLKKGD